MPAGPGVIALISAYNEADILGAVLTHLTGQGLAVFLIDDGSTDGTVEVAKHFLGRGLIGIERRVSSASPAQFDWTEILRRKEALADVLDADWFIHHDADEFRESPWHTLSLLEAVREVDRSGFNAIDFRLLNFWPTEADDLAAPDIRDRQRFWAPASDWDRRQVKCWKRTPSRVDLVSSGGHDADFDGRKVYPIPFLLRHYPIRSQTHGERKVFVERKPRFADSERTKGWHVQYDGMLPTDRFVRRSADLQRFDPIAVRESAITAAVDTAQELQRRVERLGRAVDAAADEEIRLENQLWAAERELSDARDRLQQSQRHQDAQRRDIRALQEAVAHAEVGEADLSRELRAVYASLSWRWTHPLRAVYSALSGAPLPVLGPRHDASNASETATIDWGTLNRVTPLSERWGFDRGTPIDRHYVHAFLTKHRSDICKRVLEVKDAGYTRQFGGEVEESAVLDLNRGNPQATIIGDLTQMSHLPASRFDCFICTQTLHIIYDLRAALTGAEHLLAPGGVLLCTLPAVSRVSDEDGGLEGGDYWRLTRAAVQRLFDDVFAPGNVTIETFGNVKSCSAFLFGIAAEEVGEDTLLYNDPWFPLIHCVRAVKRS